VRGKKTTDEKKEEVRAVIYLNPEASNRDIAKQTNLPESTVREVKKDIVNTDEFDEVRSQKKREFIGRAWNVVQKALELTERRFNKALDNEAEFDELMSQIASDGDMTAKQKESLISKLRAVEMANIKDIAITLGTIYDKQALASGEPTQITERQEPTPDLVKELEEKLARFKQMTGT
jgi:IS30 family transposase